MGKEIELFIEKLDAFTSRAFDIADKHRVAGRIDGLACYYFGRCISCFMGVKTLLFSLNLAGSQNDFAEKYINSLPERFPRKDLEIAQRYIKETHMAIRFVLFQNFFSQTEFTFRIIQREKLADDGDKNPLKLMAEKYGILEGTMPNFLNDVRNTIHNNGHFFPKHNTDKEYEFNGKQFKFIVGQPIMVVTMPDILAIVEYLLEETIKLFEIDELALIEFEKKVVK